MKHLQGIVIRTTIHERGDYFMIQTIVELYDKEPIENVLAACIFKPELLIYICDVRDNSWRKENAVYRMLRLRGLETQVRFFYIDTNNITAIRKTMVAITRDYPKCVFDCSGGKDLVLLTAGVFCREKDVPAFYIDANRGKLVDINACEYLVKEFMMPKFSAEDIFALSGAKFAGYGHFDKEQLKNGWEKDVANVWDLVIHNPDVWGSQVGYFQAAGKAQDELYINAPMMLKINKQTSARCNPALLKKLEKCGVVSQVKVQDNQVQFRYKSLMHKKCLQNHGIWLEMYLYFAAKRSGSFNDVRTSVVVDWDNNKDSAQGTRNEIDVLLVKGITPIFISCKMGLPSPLALTEIKILSEKFGGQRTRTVLATAVDVQESNHHLAQRAKDLDIVLIDKTCLNEKKLMQILTNLAT